MNKYIAYCGLNCEKCEARIATINNDINLQKEVAKKWSELNKAYITEEMIENKNDNFDVKDCFDILKAVSQTVCPTVVSMVFDVNDNTVYWCENRQWEDIKQKNMKKF